MIAFDFQPRTRVVFGDGAFGQLGDLARAIGIERPLIVADRGIRDVGYVADALRLLAARGISASAFDDFGENPDSAMVERGRGHAASLDVDSLIGLGGGSSLDCAKGINFLLTNGGSISDYRGYGKARRPLLPMIGIPTTAGTGSEAQSYAVVSDASTHMKIACGAPSAAFRVAILDPELTRSAPRHVTAMAGFDAIAHAVETAVTLRRTPLSAMYSQHAWRLLSHAYERVLEQPADIEARSAMQLGAHLAGAAIEQSMLGAAHACANPLTARYDIAHGLALGMLLPHVVRWNAARATGYDTLVNTSPEATSGNPANALAQQLERLATAGGIRQRLRDRGVVEDDLPELAYQAAQQWTGTFNPRPFDAAGALEIYRAAL
jgi:alcohol dehydrogenase